VVAVSFFLMSTFLIPSLPLISLFKLSYNQVETALGANYLSIRERVLVYIAAASFGVILSFIILLYQNSKILQSNNQKGVDVTAAASSSTILGDNLI